MTRLALRHSQFAAMKSVAGQFHVLAAAHEDIPVPGDVAGGLRAFALLQGIPFGYLVPDEAMLPKESIRFFILDPNWINALLQGAASLGRSCSLEATVDAALVAKLYAAATPPSPVTGFILRSNVVTGWPGIEVRAYDSNNTRLTTVLRQDVLAPTVLLFMAQGVIDHVDLSEPAEALHFGVDIEGSSKSLRYVTVPPGAPDGTQPGDQVQGATAAVTYRAAGGGKRVLKVGALAATVQTALATAKANLDPDTGQARPFTAAEFALELVEGVQGVRFVNTGKERSA